MYINQIEIGYKFQHGIKGEGIIVDKTKRTLTAVFEKSKVKVTYRYADARFSPSDF